MPKLLENMQLYVRFPIWLMAGLAGGHRRARGSHWPSRLGDCAPEWSPGPHGGAASSSSSASTMPILSSWGKAAALAGICVPVSTYGKGLVCSAAPARTEYHLYIDYHICTNWQKVSAENFILKLQLTVKRIIYPILGSCLKWITSRQGGFLKTYLLHSSTGTLSDEYRRLSARYVF